MPPNYQRVWEIRILAKYIVSLKRTMQVLGWHKVCFHFFFKYVQFLFHNYTLIKLEKNKRKKYSTSRMETKV